MPMTGVLAVVVAYLLGSIPSAYLMGRFRARIDLRQQGDGHVSATAVYRQVGRTAFILTILADIAKGILAVYLADVLTGSTIIMVTAAYAAVIGHCWSVFIRFRGGLGATISYAVVFILAFWGFIAGGIVALILMFTTHKSSLSTYALLVTASLTMLLENKELIIILFPVGLIIIQLLKRFQIEKTSPPSEYRNELFSDLKRQG